MPPPLLPLAFSEGGDDASEYLFALGVTDGLPVVPPTVGKVDTMLRATSRAPDEVLGVFPPNLHACTVAHVAANAVMAGCAPVHFRVVLAAVEAALSDSYNFHGAHCTTMGGTPCVIVGGPAAVEAGINFGLGALGSGTRSNAVVGRALKLCLQNIGGARLGGTESTTIGSANKFTMCLAENEALIAGSGWLPLARDGASRVSLLTVVSGPEMLVDFATIDADELVDLLALRASVAYAPHIPYVDEALVVISPEHFVTLHKGGYVTKEQFALALWRRTNAHFSLRFASCVHNILLTKESGGASRVLCAAIRLLAAAFALLLSALFATVRPLRARPASIATTVPLAWRTMRPLAACLLTEATAAALAPSVASVLPPATGTMWTWIAAALCADVLLGLAVGPALGGATRWIQGALLPKFTSPASFHIVVAGGAAGKFSSLCPCFGVGLPGMATSRMSTISTAAVEAKPRFAPTAFAHPVGAVMHFPHAVPTALLDPRAGIADAAAPLPSLRAMQPRRAMPLSSKSAKVALIDINKGVGGKVILRRLGARLKRTFPALAIEYFTKRTFAQPAAATLLDRIVEVQRCTHAIVALAD